MEYCPNGCVLNHAAKYPDGLPKKQLETIAYCLINAVAVCHRKQIAHRDIKPTNILIDSYGKPKLADFGLCYQAKAGEKITSHSGSTGFMAPEEFSNKPYDPFKADIWSIGITLFILYAGQLPWSAKQKPEMIEEIKKGFQHPLKFKEDPIMQLICVCLQVDPDKRPTAEELLNDPMFADCTPNDTSLNKHKTRPRSFHSGMLKRKRNSFML